MKNIGFLLIGLFAVALAFGGNRAPFGASPPPEPTAAIATSPNAGAAAGASRFTPEGITIARGSDEQFHLDLAVNGSSTRFLVDTGADVVALTEADAQRAGIAVDPGAYRPILRTASGEGMGMPVKLDRLEMGTSELRNIDAVVVKDLDTSLLGQSVLGRIGRVELRGDAMVLEPAR
ncbi:TIGR02281 family clan AA aspartic protease [Novosphingobium flavum]|uniref:TIGR02281 family clan AA aspartic protease n=1 Tax=Novosphingobium aerophilum TaxID=2839843 RepID=A0A7X1F6L2_9SPHN|nr:TIGR02281 family clan AA aspartic protease [Novosphingobium aerophilum]MBC2651372.1 TIGR02281 family clan AA aspartic protease [Novosphingobium aerophilum]MBC2661176.1 TIGR02281 family clan AA aspartic protease [Novosphingobium aerophilum]